ncbi:hypothetical protein [Actomonas aquatica]|uniref:Uncharacterized protein n=1 Tax=Actomonas aquatica TaxID=2866162 RepID=A0ABZ1C5W3_9BACT|nr:hypothetical protein [Opitutus sp. WL0086]WRQ86989.1 hypothetical protein K1X11_019415 [Opitutus sp. WL0086]
MSFSHPWSAFAEVQVVNSFAELVATPFAGAVNALCWPRELAGDFGEVVAQVVALGGGDDITTLDEEDLMALSLGARGREARAVLIEDLRRLTQHGLQPSLDCFGRLTRDESGGPVSTDVQSWHVDAAPVIVDTYLCSYTTASSEGLRTADALLCTEIPAVRAALLAEYGGADDDGFRAYLREQYYDLHYEAAAGAVPFAFGFGNMWRIANQCPGSPVPPCVHRAPSPPAGAPPRLLLIS